MKIVLATHNKDKSLEMVEILSNLNIHKLRFFNPHHAVQPPSTGSVAQLTMPASSLAR